MGVFDVMSMAVFPMRVSLLSGRRFWVEGDESIVSCLRLCSRVLDENAVFRTGSSVRLSWKRWKSSDCYIIGTFETIQGQYGVLHQDHVFGGNQTQEIEARLVVDITRLLLHSSSLAFLWWAGGAGAQHDDGSST